MLSFEFPSHIRAIIPSTIVNRRDDEKNRCSHVDDDVCTYKYATEVRYISVCMLYCFDDNRNCNNYIIIVIFVYCSIPSTIENRQVDE